MKDSLEAFVYRRGMTGILRSQQARGKRESEVESN